MSSEAEKRGLVALVVVFAVFGETDRGQNCHIALKAKLRSYTHHAIHNSCASAQSLGVLVPHSIFPLTYILLRKLQDK